MQVTANGTKGPTEWQAVNWQQVNKRVRNLRRRIFRASREGDKAKVKNLQKLMLRSYANTLQSVRRVTQENAGKDSPGVDKVLVKTPEARGQLVDELMDFKPWQAQPVKRVYITKADGKQRRPLGIPTIQDRCLQTRVKNALEPQWEAKFEASSYGFRPGRSCHDAVKDLWLVAKNAKKVWALKLDIAAAFDTIQHTFLLKALASFPAKALVKQWLKAGVMDQGVHYETRMGAPQGSPLSPLLLNISLDGLEEVLGVKWYHGSRSTYRAPSNPYVPIRYADDAVILTDSMVKAQAAKDILETWLAVRGLSLSAEKTRIVHLSEGFDFLGFNCRLFPSKRKRSGQVLHIKPSKTSIQRLKARLREEWLELKGHNALSVIRKLNPIIRGWAHYFRYSIASETFSKLDTFMFRRECRYAKHSHPKKSRQWREARYFAAHNLARPNDRWVFGDKAQGVYLWKFRWVKVQRHVKVKGRASPDDPSLNAYWSARKSKTHLLHPIYKQLATYQKNRCPVCQEPLDNGEIIQRHHLILDKTKPERKLLRHQRLVHLYCHQQIHSRAPKTKALLELIRLAS